MTFTRGDNFQAFGGLPIEIDLVDATEEEKKEVKRAIAVINKGVLAFDFINPTFPLQVEIDETQSKKLSDTNVMELIVFDSENKKTTCEGRLVFNTKGEIYNVEG